jgi:hypothetical protein
MPKIALLDACVYIEGYDFTGDAKSAMLSPDVDTLDATTFGGNGWKEVTGGLKTTSFEMGGVFDQANKNADFEAFTGLGDSGKLAMFAASEVETQPGYMWKGTKTAYDLGGSVGDLFPFNLKMEGADRYGVIRGPIAKVRGNAAATGVVGSVLNLGAPIAGQRVYVGLQVFSAGTTLTAKLQSDTASNFPSSTDRGTLGPITTKGGYFLAVDGPFSGETHWRLNISAITGTFNLAAIIAVQ